MKKYYISWPNNEVRFDTVKPSFTADYYQLGRKVLEVVEYKEIDWAKVWAKYDAWVPHEGYTVDDVKRVIQNIVTSELED